MKVVGAFNQEKALVGAFSVIVKTGCGTDGSICGTTVILILISVYDYQFVHDQTVRLMNKGLAPREIAARVKLPPHLATHPYLIEYYGTVEWSGTGCRDSAGLLEHPVQCGRCTTATWAGSPGVPPSSTRCPSTRRPGGWSGWRGAGGQTWQRCLTIFVTENTDVQF